MARPKRSLSPRFPVALTASMVQALEPEIGSICPHSLERLKRRCAETPTVNDTLSLDQGPQNAHACEWPGQASAAALLSWLSSLYKPGHVACQNAAHYLSMCPLKCGLH